MDECRAFKLIGTNLEVAARNYHDRSPEWLMKGVAETGRRRAERANAQLLVAGHWAGRASWAGGWWASARKLVDDSWRSLSEGQRQQRSGASSPPSQGRGPVSRSARAVGQASLAAQCVDVLSQVTQSLEVEEEASSAGSQNDRRSGGVVG